MKKPGNKIISIYLIWVLIHITMWGIATPGEYSQSKFYPWGNGQQFQINYVYDFTEFAFYTIAPILIYYAISFWNKKPNA